MSPSLQKQHAPWVTAPFLVGVALLSVAALLAGPVSDHLQFRHAKLGLPLVRPFSELAEAALGPYRVVDRLTLEPEVVEALGTKEYINWFLEDLSVDHNDPLRFASLLVTYYSGGHDLVPHTPDVCYLGAGYQQAQPHENIKLDLRVLEAQASYVPARLLTFARTSVFDRQEMSVVYTFFCNGEFVDSGTYFDPRTGVRMLINTPSNVYAYFSKIESSFPRASRDQSVDGARKLFGYVLPALIRDHLPDFKAAEAHARETAADQG